MGKIFLNNNFTPFVYVQNDQRVMGIILRCVCFGVPPPPARGPWWLTARPAYPGLGQRSPPSPPPLETAEHPQRSGPGRERPRERVFGTRRKLVLALTFCNTCPHPPRPPFPKVPNLVRLFNPPPLFSALKSLETARRPLFRPLTGPA